ncbi:adenosylcobinamide-GDP ribazoletransferase [Chengkuizengella axinellae]|uniref:Adenosylcobinamide-GDP ribazoletransferase n=1 Tax=Chengkuizengella axinellae TaxID=3064388 RepID=A0ABT9J0W3_9BACL|nr:adenosylcobinamide-GDP ribazoletransferase [Chengkuizengella sp. 2205SS18-9]MDP5275210.1 adenosylcobinamide-GDP ribazoletransferase [Chengkuizengella sp. 2205SS18-9]
MRTLVHISISWFYAFISSLQFLTRLPIPINIPYERKIIQRSVVYYPIAGLIIGLFLLILSKYLPHVLPAAPAAVFICIFWIISSGGLHMDGLMDTADGILSYRSKDKMLEIMKDSRVGAMGVIVFVCSLFFKTALLFSLLDSDPQTALLTYLIFIPIWSRLMMVWAARLYPYARQEKGFGTEVSRIPFSYAVLATGNALMSSLFMYGLLIKDVSWSEDFIIMLFLFLISGITMWGIAHVLNRKLGGLTGDTYGAINELVEIVLLMSLVIYGHAFMNG